MFLWGEVSPYAAIPPFVEAFHATSPQTGEYAATPSSSQRLRFSHVCPDNVIFEMAFKK